MNSPVNTYKKNQINTTSSEQLVLMLYDGARKFIGRAIKSLEEGDIQGANHNLLRSQDIISELMTGINFEAGEVAKGLFALYEYMHYRLMQANIQKDSQAAQEVLAMINELRDTWVQVLKSRYSRNEENLNLKKLRIS
ncbi:MAG: flagellar export chaperone FliS [Syntrophomonadaceae bacterium]|nr:flagellar export chaperone FliS [Syntrophomonadaceae bacterium]